MLLLKQWLDKENVRWSEINKGWTREFLYKQKILVLCKCIEILAYTLYLSISFSTFNKYTINSHHHSGPSDTLKQGKRHLDGTSTRCKNCMLVWGHGHIAYGNDKLQIFHIRGCRSKSVYIQRLLDSLTLCRYNSAPLI